MPNINLKEIATESKSTLVATTAVAKEEFNEYKKNRLNTENEINSKITSLLIENAELKDKVKQIDIKCNVYAAVAFISIIGIIIYLNI